MAVPVADERINDTVREVWNLCLPYLLQILSVVFTLVTITKGRAAVRVTWVACAFINRVPVTLPVVALIILDIDYYARWVGGWVPVPPGRWTGVSLGNVCLPNVNLFR